MTWWNPTMSMAIRHMSDNPFEQFDTWEDFLSHYATDENEIIRKGGPGSAIQAGEWYLTTSGELPPEDADWFLSYVRYKEASPYLNEYINFVKLFRDTPKVLGPMSPKPWDWRWDSGDKDAWGSHKYHYKVDFDQMKRGWDFINWIDSPFISFK